MEFFKFDKNNEEHCGLKYVAVICPDGYIKMGRVAKFTWGNGATGYNINVGSEEELWADGEYICPVTLID